MKAVIGLLQDNDIVKDAIDQLRAAGFDPAHLAILTPQKAAEMRDILENEPEETTGKGALLGTGLGSVLGLLGSVAVLPLPGFGPVVAAGLGTASGAIMGGYYGALYSSRAATQSEHEFKEALAEGGVLVIAEVSEEEEAAQAKEILDELEGQYVDTYEIDEDNVEELSTTDEAPD